VKAPEKDRDQENGSRGKFSNTTGYMVKTDYKKIYNNEKGMAYVTILFLLIIIKIYLFSI